MEMEEILENIQSDLFTYSQNVGLEIRGKNTY